MSSLKNTLTEAMKDAMRAKAKFRLGVIRMVLADIKRVEVDERIEVDDARCLSIIDKMTKQRRDAANQFVDGGRQDLADIHSSKPSVVRWLSAGNVPTIPFLQHSITNFGPEIRNIGAATTGRFSALIKLGLLIYFLF